MLRLIALLLGTTAVTCSAWAHHPERDCQPVRPRIDVIGPIGSNLPLSYRRRFNRPTNLGGWLAYKFVPTSQEAITWHKASHRGNYKNNSPRTEMQYFYPKPWEVLKMGPRPQTVGETDTRETAPSTYGQQPTPVQPELTPVPSTEDEPAGSEQVPPAPNVDPEENQTTESPSDLPAPTDANVDVVPGISRSSEAEAE